MGIGLLVGRFVWFFSYLGGVGAGEGNRTLVVSLGSFCSAIELHPQIKHLARSCVIFYSTPLRGTLQTRRECHIDEPLVNISSTNAGDLIG